MKILNTETMEFEEVVKLTKEEQKFLSCFEDEFQYIARDGIGLLWVYNQEPKKQFNMWVSFGIDSEGIQIKRLKLRFENILWEDEKAFKFR